MKDETDLLREFDQIFLNFFSFFKYITNAVVAVLTEIPRLSQILECKLDPSH